MKETKETKKDRAQAFEARVEDADQLCLALRTKGADFQGEKSAICGVFRDFSLLDLEGQSDQLRPGI